MVMGVLEVQILDLGNLDYPWLNDNSCSSDCQSGIGNDASPARNAMPPGFHLGCARPDAILLLTDTFTPVQPRHDLRHDLTAYATSRCITIYSCHFFPEVLDASREK